MRAIRATLPVGTDVELWWQDEARVGQKNTLPRRWARRGTRPTAPKDQRTEYAYIFGAICPEKGKGAGLVLPRCNAQAMNAHLVDISLAVDPGAHAVLMLDGAGWHVAGDLVVPNNITLLQLPARAPELNPVENVWQFIRDNGSAAGSSHPTMTSSTAAATPGTSSPINPGRSCPSDYANGPIGYDQRPLVLGS